MAENSDTASKSSTESGSSMGLGMRATIKLIRAKFSGVKDVSTETLHSWLHGGAEDQNVVLMDCRDEGEYDVSHLAGAQRVDWQNGDPQQLLESIPSDKPCTVVCYCSIGYRSSALADKLQAFLQSGDKGKTAGVQPVQVYNLEGSLFKWANEGRPMINVMEQPTVVCHPYNAVWGKLLNKDLRCSDVRGSKV
ncbi:putative adenylyltransferase/sulfurtransferase MoeZ [Babylonia areolata]|uniref:putative adenylyltransferase/sulfurtransferase MoeZ n=1 Tax=Babylonia areolata TaxID=304850 RepID=UPI003FD27593